MSMCKLGKNQHQKRKKCYPTRGLNPGPLDYEAAALPTELLFQANRRPKNLGIYSQSVFLKENCYIPTSNSISSRVHRWNISLLPILTSHGCLLMENIRFCHVHLSWGFLVLMGELCWKMCKAIFSSKFFFTWISNRQHPLQACKVFSLRNSFLL